MNLQRPISQVLRLPSASSTKLIDAATSTSTAPSTPSDGVDVAGAIGVHLCARVQAADLLKAAQLRVWVYMPSSGKWVAYTTVTLNKLDITGESGEYRVVELALVGYSRMALSISSIDAGLTLTVWAEKVVNQ